MFAGAVSVTVGGWFAAGSILTLTAADVAVAPLLSAATAVSEYVPALEGVQVTEYRAALLDPMGVDPAKKSTRAIVPSASLAAAVT